MNTKEFIIILERFIEGMPNGLEHLTDFEGTETLPVMLEVDLPKKVVELLENHQRKHGMEEYKSLIEEALLKSLIGTCGRHQLAITPDMLTLLIAKDKGYD